MLERMQRYCVKLIQGFNRNTRSNICCTMHDLTSVEAYIDSLKLKFLRRLMVLPNNHLSKQVMLRRLFQAQLMPDSSSGFTIDAIRLLKKYNLDWALFNFVQYGTIPDKLPWKYMVKLNVRQKEEAVYKDNTVGDSDFVRFRRIHPDIFTPSPVWKVAKSRPSMLGTCVNVAKIIAAPPNEDDLLCEHCGYIFRDKMVHYACNCSYTLPEREMFWNIIHNGHKVELAALLTQ